MLYYFVVIYYFWIKYKELSFNFGNIISIVLFVVIGFDIYVNNERIWYWLSKYGFLFLWC